MRVCDGAGEGGSKGGPGAVAPAASQARSRHMASKVLLQPPAKHPQNMGAAASTHQVELVKKCALSAEGLRRGAQGEGGRQASASAYEHGCACRVGGSWCLLCLL